MIGDAIRADVDSYVNGMPKSNALFLAASSVSFTTEMAFRYVASVRHMVAATPRHMTAAAKRSRELGLRGLEEYCDHKRIEEMGHDVWGTNDLDQLGARLGTKTEPRTDVAQSISPVVVELMQYLERLIDRDPRHYLVYAFFVEYVTAQLGDEWLALVERRCGIPRSMLTILDHHVELDGDHAAEGVRAMDELIADPSMLPALRRTLRECIAYFDAFGHDVVHGSGRDRRVA